MPLFGKSKISVPRRDPIREGTSMMGAYKATTPDRYAMFDRYAPEFSRAGVRGAGAAAREYIRGAGEILPAATGYAGRISAAERELNPELEAMQLMAERYGMAPSPGERYVPGMRQAITTAAAPSRIDEALEAEAYSRTGAGLSEREKRTMTETMRSAAAGRGTYRSNPALLKEAMGITAADEDRRMRNMLFASGVSGELLSRGRDRANLYGYGMESEDALMSRRIDRLMRPMATRAARRVDPSEIMAEAYGMGTGAMRYAPTFDPYSAYAQDVYSSNQAAAATEAAANQRRGWLGQALRGVGDFAVGMAGGRWGSN